MWSRSPSQIGAVGSGQPFECDNPMDMQFGADGAFYLLTYGNGFNVISPDAGMYKWEYVKGQRAPNAVMSADRTDGPAPLTVQFSSDGSRDPDHPVLVMRSVRPFLTGGATWRTGRAAAGGEVYYAPGSLITARIRMDFTIRSRRRPVAR